MALLGFFDSKRSLVESRLSLQTREQNESEPEKDLAAADGKGWNFLLQVESAQTRVTAASLRFGTVLRADMTATMLLASGSDCETSAEAGSSSAIGIDAQPPRTRAKLNDRKVKRKQRARKQEKGTE